ncbi:MAG: type II toxin-antitoxin system PemK/MazF family toxin [Treponema sp.]|nr:type II toxin-antitoxin system PemK/MazF family toxin [Treponema sp.]
MMCGDVYWIDLGVPFGSEPGFRRPCVVIQNDILNKSNLNTTLIIPFTSNIRLAEFTGNVLVEKQYTNLSKDSVALCSQITTVDKKRLIEKIGHISSNKIQEITLEISKIIGNM